MEWRNRFFALRVFMVKSSVPRPKGERQCERKLQQEYDELTAKEQAAKDAESDGNEQGHNDGAKGESASGGQDVDKQ